MIEIEVTSLYKHFGKEYVISDLNFSSKSSIIGIAGVNGSGKSTLLRCLSGLLKANRGDIVWKMNDKKLTKDELRIHSGYAAPYIELYEELTVIENLNFILKLRSANNLHESFSVEALNEANALKLSDQFYGDLSTGQRQRIKLVSALLHKPNILFLDEPGSNLDADGRELIEKIVNKYRVPNHMVVLASNLEQELQLCDQIIEL